MRILLICICSVFCTVIVLTSCTAYRIDIQQGNIVDTDDLDKVQLGMSKRQVQYILGTPILKDPFHPNRWDYLHTFKPGNGETRIKSLILLFDNDKLVKQINHYHDTKLKPES